MFKSYKTTQETKVRLRQRRDREKTIHPPQQTIPLIHQKISPNRTTCNAKQTEILKRLKNKMPKKKARKLRELNQKEKPIERLHMNPKKSLWRIQKLRRSLRKGKTEIQSQEDLVGAARLEGIQNILGKIEDV